MLRINEIFFILAIVIIFTLILLSLYLLINRANNRRRELKDLEQRLQMQEQLHLYYLAEHARLDVMEPAIVKEGHLIREQEKPTHQLKEKSISPQQQQQQQNLGKPDSLLKKVYGFRNASSSPPIPQQVIRPSAARSPSFLPMKDRPRSFISETKGTSPPAYNDYTTSIPISDEK